MKYHLVREASLTYGRRNFLLLDHLYFQYLWNWWTFDLIVGKRRTDIVQIFQQRVFPWMREQAHTHCALYFLVLFTFFLIWLETVAFRVMIKPVTRIKGLVLSWTGVYQVGQMCIKFYIWVGWALKYLNVLVQIECLQPGFEKFCFEVWTFPNHTHCWNLNWNHFQATHIAPNLSEMRLNYVIFPSLKANHNIVYISFFLFRLKWGQCSSFYFFDLILGRYLFILPQPPQAI